MNELDALPLIVLALGALGLLALWIFGKAKCKPPDRTEHSP